jgi:glycosyltransferase involved in cell wall biosynthesis
MLAAGDLGLSFIQSCFSKMGSSPTKVAEYLAMGMPVVVNADIGDQRDLAVEANAAIAIEDFGDESLDAAAARAVSLAKVPYAQRRVATRDVATRHFGLIEVGITRYAALYQELQ